MASLARISSALAYRMAPIALRIAVIALQEPWRRPAAVIAITSLWCGTACVSSRFSINKPPVRSTDVRPVEA
jgi:hypothetical protein